MPFGIGNALGTGIALSGTPNQAYVIEARQQAQRLARQQAERVRKEKEDDKSLIQINDFVKTNMSDLTPKATPIAQEAAKALYSEYVDLKRANNGFAPINSVPDLIQKYYPDFVYAKTASKIENEARGKDGFADQSIGQFYNSRYGDYSMPEEEVKRLRYYGFNVDADEKGRVLISGNKNQPFDFRKAVDAYSKNPNVYVLDPKSVASKQNINGIESDFYAYNEVINPAEQLNFTQGLLKDPNVRKGVRYEDIAPLLEQGLTQDQAIDQYITENSKLPTTRQGTPMMGGNRAATNIYSNSPAQATPTNNAYVKYATPSNSFVINDINKLNEELGAVISNEYLKNSIAKKIEQGAGDTPLAIKEGAFDGVFYPNPNGGGQLVVNRKGIDTSGVPINPNFVKKQGSINITDEPVYDIGGRKMDIVNKNVVFTDFVNTTLGGKTRLWAIARPLHSNGIDLMNESYYVPVSGAEGQRLSTQWAELTKDKANPRGISPMQYFENNTNKKVVDATEDFTTTMKKYNLKSKSTPKQSKVNIEVKDANSFLDKYKK